MIKMKSNVKNQNYVIFDKFGYKYESMTYGHASSFLENVWQSPETSEVNSHKFLKLE